MVLCRWNIIRKRHRYSSDMMNSALIRWRFVVKMDPVCIHQIAVREGPDDRSCLTRPHSQARPWTRKTCFLVPLMTRRVGDQTAVDPCPAEHADRTNLSRSSRPRDRRFHDAVAEIGRNPVNKHEIQPEYGDEQADAGRDCRTGTGKYSFSLSS